MTNQVELPRDPPAGWNRRRPVVLSLMAPPPADPLSLIQTVLIMSPMSFRSRIVVPATDAEALMRSLDLMGKKLGCNPPRAKAPTEEAGGTLLRCNRFQIAARLSPKADGVEMDLLHTGRLEAEDLRAFSAPPHRKQPSRSPAKRYLGQSSGLVSLYLQPHQLRAIRLYQAAIRLPANLSGAAPKDRWQMMAAGLSDLLRILAVTSPAQAELDDYALDLDLGQPRQLRVKSVLSLTPHGAALLKARRTRATPRHHRSGALISLRYAIDLQQLNAEPLVVGLSPHKVIPIVLNHELLPALLSRKPLGLIRFVQQLDPSGLQERTQQQLEREDKLKRKLERLLSVEPAKLPSGVVAEYKLGSSAMQHLFTGKPPLVRGRFSHSGRALTHEGVCSFAGEKPRLDWSWPSGGAEQSAAPAPGSRALACINRLYIMLAHLFDVETKAQPALRVQEILNAPNRAKQALACALSNPTTRQEARAIQALLVALLVSRQLALFPDPPPDSPDPFMNWVPQVPRAAPKAAPKSPKP